MKDHLRSLKSRLRGLIPDGCTSIYQTHLERLEAIDEDNITDEDQQRIHQVQELFS